jgi:hypothetical protein
VPFICRRCPAIALPFEGKRNLKICHVSIISGLGLGLGRKARYALVVLGDIAQEAMLPGIACTGYSELVALVSSDTERARKVGGQSGVTQSWAFEGYKEMLGAGSVDAIYLATPNWRHAEFAVPALRAGVHVLVEKPLEVTTIRHIRENSEYKH